MKACLTLSLVLAGAIVVSGCGRVEDARHKSEAHVKAGGCLIALLELDGSKPSNNLEWFDRAAYFCATVVGVDYATPAGMSLEGTTIQMWDSNGPAISIGRSPEALAITEMNATIETDSSQIEGE